ncbi:hypothetical protein SY88_06650 [Clostridiales bacterium PH28_bin88]|nr:hypothetical protein SY88_06650 [Clostridiales bacterium PH28_bin88]
MGKIRVLVADDVSQTRKEIQRLLSFEEDMVVIGEAVNGEEAVRLAEELLPDVVLMDVNMPVMDGIAATEQISLRVPQVATIIVSIQGEHEYLKKAMVAGAREYLVKPLNSHELAAAIRNVYQMETCRHQAHGKGVVANKRPREGRMVVVFSPKGGVGKTTVATNTGIALAQAKAGKVALVDLDLQFGDVGLMLNLIAKRNIGELVREEEQLDTELVESYLVPHFSGLRVMVGPDSPQDAELVTAERVKRVLSLVRQSVDWMVVDTAPGLNDICLDVLEASDHILMLVTPDLAAVKSVRVCLQLMESLNLRDKTRVVLNRANMRLGLKAGDVEKGLGCAVWKQVPNDEAVVIEAVNKGVPFVLSHGSAPISESIRALVGGLIEGEQVPATGVERRRGIVGKIFSF